MDKIPNTDEKFREKIKEKLEEKGFIKKNPNRSSSEIRKFLQSELQLWFRFGILKKNGRSFFNEDLGFYFHMDKINEIKLSYHKIYDKVEETVLLNI